MPVVSDEAGGDSMTIDSLKKNVWIFKAIAICILALVVGLKIQGLLSANAVARAQLASQAKVVKQLEAERAAIEKQFAAKIEAQAQEVVRLHQINAQAAAAMVQAQVMAKDEIVALRASLSTWPEKFDTLSLSYQQLAIKSDQQGKLLAGKDLEISALQGYSALLLAQGAAKDQLLTSCASKLQETIGKALRMSNHRWVLAVGATVVVAPDGQTHWGIGGTVGLRIF
jgi:hypothetical protein